MIEVGVIGVARAGGRLELQSFLPIFFFTKRRTGTKWRTNEDGKCSFNFTNSTTEQLTSQITLTQISPPNHCSAN
ncbi:MAG: hypothetical protein GY820_46750 [Gammaproteobacteria bacterium]|nr:hypothetical protein [Gammaproteobacteria bacterium]